MTSSAPAPDRAGEIRNLARARRGSLLGNEKAAVTVAEYFSMTCDCCDDFHRNTFPEVKKDWSLPVLSALSCIPSRLMSWLLQAHALCRVLPNANYFKMVDVLLDQQKNWVSSSDPVAKLKQYAKFAGISSQDYDAIMSDRAYLEAIVEMRQNATRDRKVQSTPTFVINGEKSFSGAMSFDEFLAELRLRHLTAIIKGRAIYDFSYPFHSRFQSFAEKRKWRLKPDIL